ncbi:hypothetical protein ACF1A5_11310 [Streptomyces sp. NPDC014864]|uniref:hypothetical protein n=1 Tax=Streptomyces sp. NPDC014864 TaxID=3364924 RepID=UPI003702B10C
MPENEQTPETQGTPAESAPAETPKVGESDPAGAEALGDAGKKALDSMKAKWREERDQRRALEARIAELETPKASGDTDQPDPDAIRREATREALTKANTRILRSEIKAAAAGKFADPADALAFLDTSKFEVGEDGEVDAGEISDAIEELLTRKPHLAAKAAPRFQGSGDGGAARKASGPAQLSRADLKGMTPAQIVKAQAEGRLNNVLGIK